MFFPLLFSYIFFLLQVVAGFRFSFDFFQLCFLFCGDVRFFVVFVKENLSFFYCKFFFSSFFPPFSLIFLFIDQCLHQMNLMKKLLRKFVVIVFLIILINWLKIYQNSHLGNSLMLKFLDQSFIYHPHLMLVFQVMNFYGLMMVLKFHTYDTKKSIVHLSKNEETISRLVDMLAPFVLQVAKKDSSMYLPTM